MMDLNVGSIRERLDSMIGVAPSGLLRVNSGVDANRLDDLLTFMSNAMLKRGKDQNSMYQFVMSDQRS